MDAHREAGSRCDFGWYDGERGHVCNEPGPHDKHKCRYCGKAHDPALRLVAGANGGFRRIRTVQAAS